MITIERFRTTYYMPADHPSPRRDQERLDHLATSLGPSAISSALRGAFSEPDENIWRIRRMQIELGCDLQQDDETIAAHWAQYCAAELVRKINDPDDADVVHFPDRAALLANFLVDTATGRAGGKWYYSMFEGLGALSPSAVIRTAVCQDPATGRDALLRLSPWELRTVAGAVANADCSRILEFIATDHGSAAPLTSLLAVWTTACDPLSLFIGVTRDHPEFAGHSTVGLIGAVNRLTAMIAEGGSDRLIQALDEGDITGISVADAEILKPILACRVEELRDFLSSRRSSSVSPDLQSTSFGGMFLLLPLLDEMPVAHHFEGPALARLWILIKCFGSARAYRMFFDPLVRRVLDIDPELSTTDFVRWQRGVSVRSLQQFVEAAEAASHYRDNSDLEQPGDSEFLRLPRHLRASRESDQRLAAAARLLLRNFAWRLPGFSQSSFRYLFENFLDLHATLENREGRRVVHLGKPPLALVLNLNGMTRNVYTCSWLGEPSFELFPEE